MSKSIAERNPFREKSALHRIYAVLAKSPKALALDEIAKRAGVPLGRTERMTAAMANPFHNAGMRRVGVAVDRADGLLWLKAVKPDATAKRPERGLSKAKAKRAKKQAKRAIRTKHKIAMPKQQSKLAPSKSNPVGPEVKNPALNEGEKAALSTLGETPKAPK